MRYFIATVIMYYIFLNTLISDTAIIENGRILESKKYSVNEQTLIISKSNKIYICSILHSITRCVLSNKKHKLN